MQNRLKHSLSNPMLSSLSINNNNNNNNINYAINKNNIMSSLIGSKKHIKNKDIC